MTGPGLPTMAIGEAFVGEGAEAAHVNTVLGRRDGPVGTAWATALASPSTGHAPFVAVVRHFMPISVGSLPEPSYSVTTATVTPASPDAGHRRSSARSWRTAGSQPPATTPSSTRRPTAS